MKIYRYSIETEEFNKIRNSSLTGQKREDTFDEYIERTGTEISIQDYFNLNKSDRTNRRRKSNIKYTTIGKPENILDELAFSEHNYSSKLYYSNAVYDDPEDLVESRTDYDTLKSYADELVCFIDDLKDAIAAGHLKISK